MDGFREADRSSDPPLVGDPRSTHLPTLPRQYDEGADRRAQKRAQICSGTSPRRLSSCVSDPPIRNEWNHTTLTSRLALLPVLMYRQCAPRPARHPGLPRVWFSDWVLTGGRQWDSLEQPEAVGRAQPMARWAAWLVAAVIRVLRSYWSSFARPAMSGLAARWRNPGRCGMCAVKGSGRLICRLGFGTIGRQAARPAAIRRRRRRPTVGAIRRASPPMTLGARRRTCRAVRGSGP